MTLAISIILLSLLLLCLLYVFLISPRLPRASMRAFVENCRYYAHRGLHSDTVPENSLPAFQKAVEAGFGIELDVQITSDGVPVVFHDNTLTRMCGSDKGIHDFTLEELEQFVLAGHEDVHIPTFEDVLATVGGKVPLIIEIKAQLPEWPDTVNAVMKLLESYEGPYCIESFNPMVLRKLRREYPSVLRGQLCEYFSVHKKEGHHVSFVLHCGEWFLYNVVARPDFIAYNCHHTKKPPFRLLTFLFPECTYISWTTRKPEEEQTSHLFDAFIFEYYLPSLDTPQDDTDEPLPDTPQDDTKEN